MQLETGMEVTDGPSRLRSGRVGEAVIAGVGAAAGASELMELSGLADVLALDLTYIH